MYRIAAAVALGLLCLLAPVRVQTEESRGAQLLDQVKKCYQGLPGFTLEGRAWTLDPKLEGERTWTLQFAQPDRVRWKGRVVINGRAGEVTLVSDGERTRRYLAGVEEPLEWPASPDAKGILRLGLGLDSIWLLLAQEGFDPSPEAVEYRGQATVDGQALETLFVKKGFPPCDLYLYVEPATGLIRNVRIDDSEGRTAAIASLRYASLEAPPAGTFEWTPAK